MSDSQKNLWAPWRMEYIDALNAGDDECFICRALEAPHDDAKNFVLWRGAHTLTIMNRYPYSSGHILIAPIRHTSDLDDLDDAVMLEIMQTTRDAKRILQLAVRAHGFNIGINLGRCAGAGLPEHLHVHVVPRWNGDTNFMPVLDDVKVIPQTLAAVRKLFLDTAAQLGLGRDQSEPRA